MNIKVVANVMIQSRPRYVFFFFFFFFLEQVQTSITSCTSIKTISRPYTRVITCSEVFAKSPAFLDSILVYSGQICWGEMYSYSFTSGKAYFVIQTWRIVKWATTWQNQQSDCAPSEDSDQPGHPFSAQWRLWSDWADLICLRWAHTHFVGFGMSWLKWFRYPCYVNCVPTTLFNLSPSIFGGRSGILP